MKYLTKPCQKAFGNGCGCGGVSIFVDVGAYSSVCGGGGGKVANTPECGWRVFGVGICEDSIKLHSSKEPSLGLDECFLSSPKAFQARIEEYFE